jgi:hypothetical protein
MWRTEINNWVAISLYKHAGRRVHRPCAARCELTTQRIAAHAYLCLHSLSTLDAKVRLISLSDCVEHYRVSDAFVGGAGYYQFYIWSSAVPDPQLFG